MTDRREPPPGYTVTHDRAAGWVACNPDGNVVAMGWKTRIQAIRQAWKAADAVTRAELDRRPGWFALAGHRVLGGPFDTQDDADARLARYVDDGTLRVACGRRTEEWTFISAPAPTGSCDHVSDPECRTDHREESPGGA